MKDVFDIDSLIKVFQKERESRQWSHTTARSELGSLIGAMRRYDGHVLQAAFGMSRLPQKIIDFAHSIEKLMYQQFVPQQNSLTPEDVGKAISNAVLADDTEVCGVYEYDVGSGSTSRRYRTIVQERYMSRVRSTDNYILQRKRQ